MPGIIVEVDGSGHSGRALEWALNEAALPQEPLTVLAVSQAAAGYWGGVIYPQTQALADRARWTAQAQADKALAALGGTRPATVTVRVASGAPAQELISVSKDADLIVVGSRGGGGFARLLTGSVSSQVTQHAHCPVVVIPAGDR